MKQTTHQFTIKTNGKGFYSITNDILTWLSSLELSRGLLTIFIPHTTASLVIQENTDPDVLKDLTDYFEALVPEDSTHYRHRSEGPDDMPSHIRSALTATQLRYLSMRGV